MTAVLLLLAIPAFIALMLWLKWLDRAYAIELAARSPEEYNVAGLVKAEVVGHHASSGVGVWRMRRLRRQLDDAAVKIERFEQEQRERKRRAQP